MFEKFNHLAEQAATNASRRRFLSRIGRGAMAATTGVAGILAASNAAHAGRRRRIRWARSGRCAADSVNSECAGKPIGAPCSHGRGRCAAPENLEVEPGVYNCNFCATGRRGGRNGGGR